MPPESSSECSLEFGEVQTFVSDVSRAKQFYQGILGLSLVQEDTNWLIFDLGGVEFVVMGGAHLRLATGSYGESSGTVLCLKTDDIDRSYQTLYRQGVRFLGPITTVPQGKYAVFTDPDGTPIELIQR